MNENNSNPTGQPLPPEEVIRRFGLMIQVMIETGGYHPPTLHSAQALEAMHGEHLEHTLNNMMNEGFRWSEQIRLLVDGGYWQVVLKYGEHEADAATRACAEMMMTCLVRLSRKPEVVKAAETL